MNRDCHPEAKQNTQTPVIFWRLARVSVKIASARYRVGLPAMFLEQLGIRSQLFEHGEILPLETRPEALVFSKSFTAEDIPLAVCARRHRVPVILDLCDNIFVDGYRPENADPRAFTAMARLSTAIVVTGPALAEVIRKMVKDVPPIYPIPDGAETEVLSRQIVRWMLRQRIRDLMGHIARVMYQDGEVLTRTRLATRGVENAISASFMLGWTAIVSGVLDALPPSARASAAETATVIERLPNRLGKCVRHWRLSWKQSGMRWLYFAVLRRLGVGRYGDTATLTYGNLSKPAEGKVCPLYSSSRGRSVSRVASNQRPRTLIWFGNYGASYSNFGMRELAALENDIAKVSARWEVEVVVVSNNYRKYLELIRPLPFFSRYVEWSLNAIYSYLGKADVALVPNARDEFSVCKSANRTILALSAGVPVVATRTPALEPFESCVIFDDWVGGIEAYLTDHELVTRHLRRASELIREHYSGPRIAQLWETVIRQASQA